MNRKDGTFGYKDIQIPFKTKKINRMESRSLEDIEDKINQDFDYHNNSKRFNSYS